MSEPKVEPWMQDLAYEQLVAEAYAPERARVKELEKSLADAAQEIRCAGPVAGTDSLLADNTKLTAERDALLAQVKVLRGALKSIADGPLSKECPLCSKTTRYNGKEKVAEVSLSAIPDPDVVVVRREVLDSVLEWTAWKADYESACFSIRRLISGLISGSAQTRSRDAKEDRHE